MPYQIVHLSDLHLDRAFSGSGTHGEHGNVARRRRLDLRDHLRRAGGVALDRKCDLITIGGDLYEHERAGPDTARFLTELFESWAPMRVAIAPGNHDPFMPGSLYERTDWPSNVHIFSEPELSPLALDDGLTLWGLAHREPAWQGDPLAGDPLGRAGGHGEHHTDPPASTGEVHIALFHGAEMGSRPEGKSVHGPFNAYHVAARGFSAALSGHYHRRRIDRENGLLYPGSPEPLTFDETGGRGPVVVAIDGNGQIDYDPLDMNTWTSITIESDLTDSRTTTGVVDDACATATTAVAGLDADRTMLRLTLVGAVGAPVAVDTFTLETALRDTTRCAVVKVRDTTSAAIDMDAAAADATARGAFTRTLIEAINASEDGAERETLEDALRYGLQALSGAEVGLR